MTVCCGKDEDAAKTPPFDNVMDLLKRHVSYVLGTEQSRTD